MHWLRQFIGPEKNTNRQSWFSLPPCPCREGWATRQTGLFTPACPGPWSGQLTNGTMKHSVHSPLSPTQAKWRHPFLYCLLSKPFPTHGHSMFSSIVLKRLEKADLYMNEWWIWRNNTPHWCPVIVVHHPQNFMCIQTLSTDLPRRACRISSPESRGQTTSKSSTSSVTSLPEYDR